MAPPRTSAWVLPLLGLSVALSAAAAVLVLRGRGAAAGGAVVAAGAGLVLAGRLARRSGVARLRFADSIGDRMADPLVLVAIAWARMPEEPRPAAAALVALVMGYLASYLRARATGLGFELEESTVDRAVRAGAIGLALLADRAEAGLWVAAAWSLAASVKRTLEVARGRETA